MSEPGDQAEPVEVNVNVQPARLVLADFLWEISRTLDAAGELVGLVLDVYHPLVPAAVIRLPFHRNGVLELIRHLQAAVATQENGGPPAG